METDSLKFITQFTHELLGDKLTWVVLVVAYVFAFFGMYMRWFFTYQNKGRKDPNTPDKFSMRYWIKDNLVYKSATALFVLIILFVTFRFMDQFIGKVFSYGYAFLVGLCLDYVVSVYKNLKKNALKNK